eukprot:COSAG01_NODE_716_length_14085_cov_18.724010_2_plen_112_part_00
MYYHHRETNQTSWDLPGSPHLPRGATLAGTLAEDNMDRQNKLAKVASEEELRTAVKQGGKVVVKAGATIVLSNTLSITEDCAMRNARFTTSGLPSCILKNVPNGTVSRIIS